MKATQIVTYFTSLTEQANQEGSAKSNFVGEDGHSTAEIYMNRTRAGLLSGYVSVNRSKNELAALKMAEVAHAGLEEGNKYRMIPFLGWHQENIGDDNRVYFKIVEIEKLGEIPAKLLDVPLPKKKKVQDNKNQTVLLKID